MCDGMPTQTVRPTSMHRISKSLKCRQTRSLLQRSLPNQDCMSVTKGVGQSKHPPSSSVIGTLTSKISLIQASTSHDADNSRISDNCSRVQTFDATSPIILPSVLSEYCRQHINQNQLRRCIQWSGPQNYSVQCYVRSYSDKSNS
jgi:hypothetical protein